MRSDAVALSSSSFPKDGEDEEGGEDEERLPGTILPSPYPPHAWVILSILPKAGEHEENGEYGLDEARPPDILLPILLILR